jgi:HlyD family secretion protein
MSTNTVTANVDPDLAQFLGAPPPRRRYRYWLLGAVLLLITLVFLTTTRKEIAVSYVTAQVALGDIEISVSATGNLAPTNQIEVGSEISGIVERVLVEVNDRVEKGQEIAKLDTARLDDAVRRAQASLAANSASVNREQATLAEANAQLGRLLEVARLSDGELPSQLELASQRANVARAQAALALAQANVLSAQAQLSSDRTQLAKAVIRSPVSGVVLRRSIDPGQTVQAAFSTPSLFIIAEDLTRMKLEVAVDEADVGRVSAGQEAIFSVDAYPGREFPARIARVNLGAKNLQSNSAANNSVSAANVVSYLASLEVANTDLSLRPGMTATAVISTEGAKQVLYVPNAALRFVAEVQTEAAKKGLQFRPPRPESSTEVVKERTIGEGSRQLLHILQANGQLRALEVLTGRSNGVITAVSAPELKQGMTVVLAQKASPTQ